MATWQAATQSVLSELEQWYESAKKNTETFYPQEITGTVYYISSVRGNDANDGKSENTPWKSCEMLKNVPLAAGDTVLFECGSLFRESMGIISGVTYSSYGTGKKPKFYGSINASQETDWEQIAPDLYRYRENVVWHNDIGNIVFDGGRAWGIKIQKCDDCDMSLRLVGVSNGIDFFEEIPSVPFACGEQLPHVNLAYFHSNDGFVYLYCMGGNPARVFSSVELSQSVKIFNNGYTENVTFSNLHFANVACFAIRTVGCKNMQVYNCAFEFIGGAIQFGFNAPWRNYKTRYGNAIENWGGCEGMTVKNCYFHQIYDAGITTQSNDEDAHQEYLCYEDNVFDCNQYAFEIWSGGRDCRFTDISVSKNVCKRVADGLPTQRPDKGHEAFFNSKGNYNKTNCRVEDNLILGSVGSLIRCNQLRTKLYDNGYIFNRNVYVSRKNQQFALISKEYPSHSSNLQAVPYNEKTVELLSCEKQELNGMFYYFDEKDVDYENFNC